MEIQQVKEHVRGLVKLGVSEKHIDAYIADCGYTVEDIRNYKEPVKSGGWDTAAKTGRAVAEGALFGLGDVLGGITNAAVAPAAKMATYLLEGTPLSATDFNPVKNFREGRKEFVEGQKEFAEKHGKLNTAAEMVGGLFTGIGGAGKVAGAKALAKLGKVGAGGVTGALTGGLYGAGSGLTEDSEKLDPVQGLKSAGIGGFLGGAFGAGVPVVWKQVGKIAHNMNKQVRAYKQLSKAAKGKLEESIDKKVPLIDMADKRALRLISGADKADMDASEMLYDYANNRMQKVKSNTEQVLDDIFGDKGYDSVLKKRHETAQKLAEPLYDKVFSVPKVKIELDPMAKLVAEELRSNPYSAQALKGYPENSFRFLDAVKRGLDYKIKAIQTGIETGKLKPTDGVVLGDLMKSRADLLAKLDKVNPNYKIARSVAEQGFKFEEGAKAGQRAFLDPADDIISKVRDMGRSGAKPDFAAMRKKAALLKGQGVAERRLAQIDLAEQIINSAAEAEKAGYKMGMGQALRKLLEGGGAAWENTPQKLFNPNRLRKMQAAGIDLKKQLPKIANEMKTAENLRGLFRGSQTAERIMDMSDVPTTPTGILTKTAKKLLSKAFVVSPKDIARMSIDPGYAAIMRAKAGRLPTGNYVDISGAGGAFSNIAGPLTSREKAEVRNLLRQKMRSQKIKKTISNEQSQIKKGYEEVKLNPLKGTLQGKDDILVTMDPNGNEKYFINRGAAISDPNSGNIIVSGDELLKETGTKGNFGFSKMIFKHDTSVEDSMRVPNIIREYQPYKIHNEKENYRIPLDDKENFLVVFGNNKEKNKRLITAFREKKDKNNTYSEKRPLNATDNSGAISVTTSQVAGDATKGSQGLTNSIANEKANVKKKKKKDFSMRDFLILLQRPYNLGQQGAIGGKNLNKGDE
ncbi:MAG: hypothetical protein IKL48_00160 [Elusimicrobiaceae bacterium]|nr:hypothetical protein [Elusimicrobiaceae bacterium]